MGRLRDLMILLSALSGTAFGQASYPSILSGVEVVSGKAFESDIAQAKLGTVIVFLSARCPCSGSHEPALKALFREYSEKGFQFVGVHSNRDESSEMTGEHFKIAALPFPVLQDIDNRFANAFGALKTPHVFVLGKNGTLLYQGGVDDSRIHAEAGKQYLRDALTEISNGKEPSVKVARTLGCVIQR